MWGDLADPSLLGNTKFKLIHLSAQDVCHLLIKSLWIRSDSKVSSVSTNVLYDRFVLSRVNVASPLIFWIWHETVNVPELKSMSCHLKPRASPCLKPQINEICNRADRNVPWNFFSISVPLLSSRESILSLNPGGFLLCVLDSSRLDLYFPLHLMQQQAKLLLAVENEHSDQQISYGSVSL